jgi:hypothetical protein
MAALMDGLLIARKPRSSRGFGSGAFFLFCRHPFPFEIALPAFSILNFVVLSSHNSLHYSHVAVL